MKAPEEYRGLPEINPELCIGCGACVNVCPPEAILKEDNTEKGIRRIVLDLARCIRCARCEEVCPMGAIKLSQEFEGASPFREDFIRIVELKLHRCPECGNFSEFTERQVREAIRIVPEELYEHEGIKNFISLCRNCRRRKNVFMAIKLAEEYKDEEEI